MQDIACGNPMECGEPGVAWGLLLYSQHECVHVVSVSGRYGD